MKTLKRIASGIGSVAFVILLFWYLTNAYARKEARTRPYGIWRVSNVIDDFKEVTQEKFISSEPLEGSFLKSTGEETNITAIICVVDSTNIKIQFPNNMNQYFPMLNVVSIVGIQDNDKERIHFPSYFTNNQLSIDSLDSYMLHYSLLKGGEIKISIKPGGDMNSQLYFEIESVDGYGKAWESKNNK